MSLRRRKENSETPRLRGTRIPSIRLIKQKVLALLMLSLLIILDHYLEGIQIMIEKRTGSSESFSTRLTPSSGNSGPLTQATMLCKTRSEDSVEPDSDMDPGQLLTVHPYDVYPTISGMMLSEGLPFREHCAKYPSDTNRRALLLDDIEVRVRPDGSISILA